MGILVRLFQLPIFSTFSQYGGLQGVIVMVFYRIGHFIFFKLHVPFLRQLCWIIYRFLELLVIRLIFDCEIPPQCHIGRGLHLPHGPKGIVINPYAKIGNNVTIFHYVTLGQNKQPKTAPTIEHDVVIGTGAKLLGDITIAKAAKIGANAVVLQSIPSGATAVGIPAQIKRS
ncbi:serine O-acetyltransferase [Listeria booriae]|uniref:Serine acetyltransferase n=1 Tax=Listeria booriae TaxID=1552123 RepID=A0A842CT34_9LIST|nr:serine O-acetyltransferase [Listeria booriae]MBC2004945.1 serine O-acetyltransferase [Listeria booriae]MBC2025014.1 serine O-acetyltransferase [Listeria booriae]